MTGKGGEAVVAAFGKGESGESHNTAKNIWENKLVNIRLERTA